MNRLTHKLVIGLWVLMATAQAQSPVLSYFKTMEGYHLGQEGLLAVALDSSIYAATQDGFADLRILDETGTETPFLLEKAAETHSKIVRIPHAGEVVSLQKLGNNGIEVFLRAAQDTPSTDGFTLHTPLRNDEHRVQVFGSNDGKNWAPLVKEVGIYDYSRYLDINNRDIELPTNPYREFKLVIEEATHPQQLELMELTREIRGEQEQERSEHTQVKSVSFRIDRIEFWHKLKQDLPADEQKFEYPITAFTAQEDPKTQTTIIEVKTQREPLTHLSLQSTNRNFSRPVTVRIPVRYGMETQWRDIGSATLQMLHLYDIHREQTAIPFPEQRQENYRIIIRNQDNPPLAITGIQAQGNGYRLIFLAAPGKAYRVCYGGAAAQKPHYDTTSIRESLQAGYLPTLARLGAEQATSNTDSADFDINSVLNSKLFLSIIIALMVAVLAWALVRAARGIEQLPKE
ncbi:DUF3999 family protein [Gammaproteobacteria bacterium]